MKLQHSSGGKNKACIVLCCLGNQHIPDQNRWVESMEYNICIVDLKSDIVGIVDEDDGFTLVSPTFQIDCGSDVQYPYVKDAFCLLGQTLYVFEGSSHQEPHASRKSVFALDLTRTQTLTQRTTKLAKDGPLLKKIGDMTLPKPCPAALPTPEGEKIVVFCQSECSFELFEPANRSWERLPSIARSRHSYISISAYGFVQGNKLLVQMYSTSGGRMYALDLDGDDMHWVRLGSIYSGVEYIPCGCSFFEMVGESRRFCFVNSSGFYDVEEYAGEYDHDDHYSLGFVPHRPRREDDGGVSFRGEYYAALLNYGDRKGVCDLCHMEIERSHSESFVQSCRAAINVCRVDLKSYTEMADRLSLEDLRWADELRHSKTKIVKTLRFSLCFEGRRKFNERHLFFTF